MKSYAIYDEDLEREKPLGYLFYYEKAKRFIIELCSDLDEWDAPILFQGLVHKGIYTVPADIAILWVRERVIPSGRQNIGMILKNHKMKEYSEIAFLTMNKGRCIQDACYIEPKLLEELPADIQERMSKTLSECFMTEDAQLLCMFKDDVVMKVNPEVFIDKYKKLLYILKNKEWRENVKIGVGGYSIIFNEQEEVPLLDIRRNGQQIPLTTKDFYKFIQRNVMSTSMVCEAMQCTRQNLAHLVKEERLIPIISGTKENMYVKGQITEIMNG